MPNQRRPRAEPQMRLFVPSPLGGRPSVPNPIGGPLCRARRSTIYIELRRGPLCRVKGDVYWFEDFYYLRMQRGLEIFISRMFMYFSVS